MKLSNWCLCSVGSGCGPDSQPVGWASIPVGAGKTVAHPGAYKAGGPKPSGIVLVCSMFMPTCHAHSNRQTAHRKAVTLLANIFKIFLLLHALLKPN